MPNQIELPPIVIRPAPLPAPFPARPSPPIYTAKPLPIDEQLVYITSIQELSQNVHLGSERATIPLCVLTRRAMKSIDARFAGHLQNLHGELTNEISAQLGESAPPLSGYLLIKKNIIQNLIVSKNSNLQLEIEASNSFFGSSPLSRNFVHVVIAVQRNRDPVNAFKVWTDSYMAARSVIVLTDAIRILTEQSTALDAEIASAQAQEQEQAALAAAHAQRLAEEQAQLAAQAAAEAQRQVQEQAAQAAAEAQRQAEEQQRLAVEERNRLEADATAAGLANTYHLKGAVAVTQPLFMTTAGAIAIVETAALTLQAAIRAAITGLTAAAASVASGLLVGVSALVYSPKLANGELPERYTFSSPLSDIAPDKKDDLHAIAATGGTIDLPFRLTSKTDDQGNSELTVIHATASNLPTSVRVIAAEHNHEKNVYSVTTSDHPARTLIWTPAQTPESASTTLPAEDPSPSITPGSTVTPIEGRIDIFPQVAETSFNDLVIVFPIDSGLAPIYVMFKDRREDPGIATGNGEPAENNWLAGASVGEGAPIPSYIADQMRDKEFRSFREFREAFWKIVGNSPDFANQLTPQNRAHVLKGRAPYARKIDRVGNRTKLEIHHRISVSDGGPIYDMDNLRITTPKLHISIHQTGKGHDN